MSEWKADFKTYVESLNLPRDDYKGIMEFIDETPLAEPKWVPVTERLPKFYEHVLVSTKKEEGFEPISVGYFFKNPYSDDIMFDDFLGTCGRYVLMEILAWMPMPKPYEEREE